MRVYDREEEQASLWDSLSEDEQNYRYKLKVVFPDGGEHEFRPYGNDPQGWPLDLAGGWAGPGYTRVLPDGYIVGQPPAWFDGDMTYYSIDGTYLRLVFPRGHSYPTDIPWTLYMPDGTTVEGNGSDTNRIYHRTHSASNPNYIQIDRVTDWGPDHHLATLLTDNLGRALVIENDFAADKLHLPGVGGQDVVITVVKTTVEIDQTYRACTNPLIRVTSGDSLPVLERIVLPRELTTGGALQCRAGGEHRIDLDGHIDWPECLVHVLSI